jgi:hypothetical protein
MEKNVAAEYLDQVRKVFRSQKSMLDKTLAQVNDIELFYTPDAESNSIAVTLKHLAGNMVSRWTDFLTSDGEKPDRHRDSEFITDNDSADFLRAYIERGYKVFFDTLDSLTEGDLLKTITIRNEPHSVIQALERQVSHYGYHLGQIVFLAKHLKGAEWKTLTIPRGKSEEFLSAMQATQKK